MHKSDFFTSSGRPSVRFDRKQMTWTLSNKAVSRAVRFDHSSGGLVPVSLTGPANGAAPLPSVVSEGEIVLTSPLAATPEILKTGWRVSESEPSGAWSTPDFDDSSWKSIDLPFQTDLENRSWWFRYRLPAGQLRPDKRYALLLDQAVDDGAEVFVDGRRVGVLTLADQPWTKVFQFPLPSDARVIAIRLEGGGRPNSLGNIRIAEISRAQTLRLDRGWSYAGQDEKDGALTIHLEGKGEQAGFNADVTYRVFPGDEPYMDKAIAVTNAGKERWLVQEILLDRYEVGASGTVEQSFTGSGRAISEAGNGRGFATAVVGLQGLTRLTDAGKRVDAVYAPFTMLEPGQTTTTPRSVLGLYRGSTATGGFLLQLYVGAYVSVSTATTVPAQYNTWFGYYGQIDEQLLLGLIPKAADLGVKTFTIDDGWQTMEGTQIGGYGDWLVNKAKFPNGLEPIAALAKKHGLRFGLWSAPIMVQDTSAIVKNHPEWLVKRADGTTKPLWTGTSAMCLSGEYAKHYKENLVRLCKEYGLGYLKLDGSLFIDGCIAENHGHPVSHSEGAQVAAWEDIVATLRHEIPGIIISRGWEGEPGVTALQNTGWFGDWAVAFHPEREVDPRWWYKNADIYRRALYDLTFTRPPFTISWEAPCHILSKPLDINALEYHYTSVGAWICNAEIHGRLMESTPEEIALVKKWVKWNEENREWLAYAQPITALGKPYDALDEKSEPRIDGVLHLRNALRGRYGYIALWNPSDKPGEARITVRPGDYFVRMDTSKVDLTSIRDARTVDVQRETDAFSFTVPMKPLSWEILEIREGR